MNLTRRKIKRGHCIPSCRTGEEVSASAAASEEEQLPRKMKVQLLQTAVQAAASNCSSSCFSVSRQLGTAFQAAAATAGPAAWKCSKLQLQLSLTLCSFFEAEAAGRLQRGKCNSPWVQLAAQLTWTNPNRTRDQLMTWTNCNLTRNQFLMWTNYNHFRSLARFIL